MAVEANLNVLIHKLTNLLAEESRTVEKVRGEVEEVLKKLSLFYEADHPEQITKKLQFLDKAYRVGDAIESFVAETCLRKRGFVKKHSLLIGSEFKLCWNVPDGMNISMLKSEMNGVKKEIQKFPGSHSMHLHEQPWQDSDAYHAPNREKTIFKKDQKTLLKQLTSDSKRLQIISVFGYDDTGKKAHVKEIYKNLESSKTFPCMALVVVNTEWSVTHLMVAILQQVTASKVKKKLEDEVLLESLLGFLKDQKYLIVINDINSRELLEELRGALPDAENGSRVVITTSNKEAASFADASTRYHFKPLDMKSGFKFFITKTWGEKKSPFSPDIMEDMRNIIAESCHGSIQRITLLAGLLSTRGETHKEWPRVFEQLKFATKSPSFDISFFCYNDVPLHLKPCLLYLTLFQKGFEIPVRRLFGLWLAEDFVKPSRGVAPEDVVEGYLKDFAKRNMVEITEWRLDKSPRKCRLIGYLHDILLPMALKTGLFHLHQKSDEHINATAEYQFGIRRVVEYTSIKKYYTSKDFNHNIQSYISIRGRKKDMPAQVELFFKRVIGIRGYGLLKVLDLEGVYLPRLPENIGNLFYLRYLGLRSTLLDSLPSSLGGLLYLETLDIKHTRINTFPSSIWNMKRLHHLYLNRARLHISAQSTKHRGPSQLKTIWGLFVDEKIARKIGLNLSRMTNLRKLDITRQTSSTRTTTTATTPQTTITTITIRSSSYEEIGSWISSLFSLQSLKLRSRDKMGQPSELIIKPLSRLENLSKLYLLGHLRESLSWYQIPPGLKFLTLSVSQLGEDPMPTLSQLPHLMVLRLLGASYVGEEMHCPKNGFPALRVLELWKLEELKLLTVNEGAMQNLQTMEIRSCGNLKRLPLSLLRVESFEKLILTSMPKEFVSAARSVTLKHTKIVEDE